MSGWQVLKRAELAVSQCALVNCTLLFNTSDLTLSGAVEANGTLALTPQGIAPSTKIMERWDFSPCLTIC